MLHADLARTDPNGLALDDTSGTSPRSWAELADRTTRLANWIGELGARPGDHVAVWMGNRVECVELMIACAFSKFGPVDSARVSPWVIAAVHQG